MGIDILFAVDTSRSMLTQDVNPDRLTRARLAVADLLAKLEGDRVGLIAFAGSAFLQCPLTLDYDAFRQSLDALDTNVIPKSGTDIVSAISEAGAAFRTGAKNHKLLVLITDGEDLAGNAVSTAPTAEQEVKIFTVGVGIHPRIDPAQGRRRTEFVKNENGQAVIAPGRALLQKISGMSRCVVKGLKPSMIMDWLRSRNRSRNEKVYTERYRVACVGILFLIMEMFGRTAERRFEFLNNFYPPPSRAMTVAVFFVISSHPPASLKWRKKRIIRENFPMLAATRPRRKDIPEGDLQFNLGASAYRMAIC